MVESIVRPDAAAGRTIDPISLEILWSRLISIVAEAETTIVRTSFSPVVGEANDFAGALLDTKGQILAQTPSGLPGFIGVLGASTRTLLQHFPPETLQPGDVLITNDPWICAGHLNDINLLRPIFYKGKIVAYIATIAHMSDVGGRNSAESVDLFEEGIRILPSKLYDAGRKNEDIYQFLAANTRMPVQLVGDVNAQLAATRIGDERLVALLEEYGLADIEELSQEIQRRTEQITRDAIRQLPDGDYFGEVTCDGFDRDIVLKTKVSVRGDGITVDFTGTSDQIDRAINCPYNLTYAEVAWTLRVMLAPDVPTTAGCLRPIKVIAPEGCILNPRFPAAVFGRTALAHNIQAPLFQALSPLVPTYIDPANSQANSGCLWGFRFRGYWTEQTKPEWETQNHFLTNYFAHGGQGATGVKDGRHTITYPENCSNMPIEVIENRTPILFLSKELRPDSAGAGEFRGGCGQRIRLRVMSDRTLDYTMSLGDKIRNAPFGLKGGHNGLNGFFGRDNEALFPPRAWHRVEEGEILRYEPPGGGGYGDPFARDPEAVRTDVADGIVSCEAARAQHGVAITERFEIDWEETRRLRSGT